jgi:hypothetical protein
LLLILVAAWKHNAHTLIGVVECMWAAFRAKSGDNLLDRIGEAEREGWLGEVDGLNISLSAADGNLRQLDDLAAR